VPLVRRDVRLLIGKTESQAAQTLNNSAPAAPYNWRVDFLNA